MVIPRSASAQVSLAMVAACGLWLRVFEGSRGVHGEEVLAALRDQFELLGQFPWSQPHACRRPN